MSEASPLLPPNVGPEWIELRAWIQWEPPINVVRGESHHQDAIRKVAGDVGPTGVARPRAAVLVREPLNPYDSNAVRVEVEGEHLGYISRELAADLSPLMDSLACAQFEVPAVIIGGSVGGPSLSIHLWADRRLTAGPAIHPPPDAYLIDWPPGQTHFAVGGAVDRYFQLRAEIKGAWSMRDFAQVADAARTTLEMLDAVVTEVLAADGSFWTSLPPAISEGGASMAVLHDRAGLEAMHRTVAGNPYLRQWLPDVEQALGDEVLSRRVLDYVGANPGVVQKDLHALLEASGERVMFVCWMAAAAGLLSRERAGTSYRLTLPQPSGDSAS